MTVEQYADMLYSECLRQIVPQSNTPAPFSTLPRSIGRFHLEDWVLSRMETIDYSL
jgi:hypothetical protein